MTDESRADVSVHDLWKWVTFSLLDMQIVNLDVGSYLHQTSTKALATAEREKNDKYVQPCLKCRNYFTRMVYSADGITGTEVVAAQRRLALLLNNNLKWEYLEMCDFVRVQMSLAIVRSNTLLLRGSRDRDAYIHQRPDLVDGSVMALLALLRG